MFSNLSYIIDVIVFSLALLIIMGAVSSLVLLVWKLSKDKEKQSSLQIIEEIKNSPNLQPQTTNLAVSNSEIQQREMTLEVAKNLLEREGFKISTQSEQQTNSKSTVPTVSNSNFSQNLPTNHPAFMLLKTGNVHMKHGDFTAAIKDFSDALILNPSYAGAYNARGMANRKMKDFQSALQDYNSALKLHNNLAAAYNNRGVIFMEIRQFEAALKDFDKALDLEPQNSYGYSNRAVAYNYMRDFNKSISESTRAVEINPHLPEAYVVRGIAKIQIGANQAATLDFDVAESLGYKRVDIEDRLNAIKQSI